VSDQTSVRQTTGRFTPRRAARAASGCVPLPWLLRLREAYLGGARSSFPRRWQRALLGVVRLRGIPQDEPFRLSGHPWLRMVPTDSYIASHLFWLGIDGYEAGEPGWWASLVSSHRSALEIGANIGLYTLAGAAATPSVRYCAVEPHLASFEVLQRNVALNGLGHVELVHAAVVGPRRADTVTLRFPDRDRYTASAGAFVDGAVDLTTSAGRSVEVPAMPITELIDGVDLVKLDIEGLETEVLGAVRPWIVETAPTIVVEARDEAPTVRAFIDELLRDVPYRCYAVSDGAPVPVARQVVTEGRLETDHRTRDVTLITPERAAAALGSRPPVR
jgi:FkbM family methyltransferase